MGQKHMVRIGQTVKVECRNTACITYAEILMEPDYADATPDHIEAFTDRPEREIKFCPFCGSTEISVGVAAGE